MKLTPTPPKPEVVISAEAKPIGSALWLVGKRERPNWWSTDASAGVTGAPMASSRSTRVPKRCRCAVTVTAE